MRLVPLFVLLGCRSSSQQPPPQPPQPPATSARATPPTSTTPVPSTPRFVDHPVGIGTCKWISIGETSEIIGQQLQYLEPDEKAWSCVLVPAKGDGPNQPLEKNSAWESRPNVWVTYSTFDVTDWTPPAGIGERSVWESDDPYATLFIGDGETTLKINVNLPYDQMPARAAERRKLVEAVARKVLVRLKANPKP